MYKHIFLAILIFTVVSCAKIGSPEGGPKDYTSPIPKKSNPENFARNYDGNKVAIKFDEFIVFKDLDKNFYVSPPFKKKVRPIIKGKKIVVELKKEEIVPGTYTISFGNSIVDFHEGNALPDFQFVFSTTDFVDSMAVKGQILNAFTQIPEKEGVMILLYKNAVDSAPYLKTPDYMCLANADGSFALNNASPGIYKLFAIKDANQNMKYDLATELIAFYEEPLHLLPDSFAIDFDQHDHYMEDTTHNSDSIDDGLAYEKRTLLVAHQDLYLFTEATVPNQYMKGFGRPSPNILTLSFNASLENYDFAPLGVSDSNNWALKVANSKNDSIVYWLTDSTFIVNDSLSFIVKYDMLDSTKNWYNKADTLLFINRPKDTEDNNNDSRRNRRRRQTEEVPVDTVKVIPKINLTSPNSGENMDLDKPIVISITTPISEIDVEKIRLYRIEDSIISQQKFQLSKDSIELSKFNISTKLESAIDYKLNLLPGAFTDIYNIGHDTIEFKYKTRKIDFYSTLIIKVSNINENTIIQLLDSKTENVIKEYFIDTDQEIKIEYLNPGEYKLKAIFDSNDNKRWDTGDFLKGLQPEKVKYYKESVITRSNWESNLNWDF